MTVTEITEVSKARMKISIDEEYAFTLYTGELRTYGIKVGGEMDPKAYESIMEELLPRRAKLRAMNLLTKRAYCFSQLRDKLEMGGYPDRIVQQALDYVASFGYVDDGRYARDYIESCMEKRSKRRIFTDLLTRGVSQEIITDAWEDVAGEGSGELEKEQISRWLLKKNFSAKEAGPKEKQKMMAFLYRKGFDPENIRSVLLLDNTAD